MGQHVRLTLNIRPPSLFISPREPFIPIESFDTFIASRPLHLRDATESAVIVPGVMLGNAE